VIDEAREKIKNIDSSVTRDYQELAKRSFYQAVEIVAEGVIEFARRYQQEALRLAKIEANPVRRSELLEIATVCEKVPARPAASFREALQGL
jgi:formate C-acetyltransferase